MIIFLYGQDTYRLRQKLAEIAEHHKEIRKSGLNLRFFDGERLNYQDFEQEFKQMPMFRERKLFILKNIFQNTELKNYFLEHGKKFVDSEDVIVFYEDSEISSADTLFKFLAKNAKVQEFKLLGGVKLRNWAKSELEKYKATAEPQAVEVLISYIGNDLWRFSNEIKKLAAFKKNKIIKLGDVDFLVKPQIETDIFKTIEAIAFKNKKTAISLLHQHLDAGDSPLYLLSMINFQFRNLLLVKEMGRLDAHPYFVRKTAALAAIFTLEDLKKIYREIFEADLKIKTGQLDPQLALDLLITGI
ncbi:MAG: DNA polymerase III subunit delta [Candidatus Nealsonbacteria bacterium]|nr:DNA polymerase III subunit delta [Candidatus Nealsonbacteria bacterium]